MWAGVSNKIRVVNHGQLLHMKPFDYRNCRYGGTHISILTDILHVLEMFDSDWNVCVCVCVCVCTWVWVGVYLVQGSDFCSNLCVCVCVCIV